MKIGIIGAMEVEVESLKDQIADPVVTTKAGMEFCEGTIGSTAVVVVRSGVGKVNAALCVQVLVDQFGVTHVLNTGVAGSLDAAINIGDIVVSTDAMYHDVDATIFGYQKGEVPQLGMRSFIADESLRKLAIQSIQTVAPEIGVFEGRVVSGDQFIADNAIKKSLIDDFNGMCCEMEGAAIAHAATVNHIPFVIIRAISDKADGSAEMAYPEFEAQAARHCAKIVQYIIENM